MKFKAKKLFILTILLLFLSLISAKSHIQKAIKLKVQKHQIITDDSKDCDDSDQTTNNLASPAATVQSNPQKPVIPPAGTSTDNNQPISSNPPADKTSPVVSTTTNADPNANTPTIANSPSSSSQSDATKSISAAPTNDPANPVAPPNTGDASKPTGVSTEALKPATTDDSSKSAGTTDDASKPATTDDASKPAATTDDASKPATTTDDASKPTATPDDATKPASTTTDDASKPAVTTDDSTKPAVDDASKSAATTPVDDPSKPAVTTDDTTKPAADDASKPASPTTDDASKPSSTDETSKPATTDDATKPAGTNDATKPAATSTSDATSQNPESDDSDSPISKEELLKAFNDDKINLEVSVSFRYLVEKNSPDYSAALISGKLKIGEQTIGLVDSTAPKFALYLGRVLEMNEKSLVSFSEYLAKYKDINKESKYYNPFVKDFNQIIQSNPNSNSNCRILIDYFTLDRFSIPGDKKLYVICFSSPDEAKSTSDKISLAREKTLQDQNLDIKKINYHDLGLKVKVILIGDKGADVHVGHVMLLDANAGIYGSPQYGDSNSLISGYRFSIIKDCKVNYAPELPKNLNAKYKSDVRQLCCINYDLVVNTRYFMIFSFFLFIYLF